MTNLRPLALLGGGLFFLVAATRPSLAQDGAALGVLTLEPTIDSVGVVLSYTGDDDQDARVQVEYQLPDGRWRPGPDMVRLSGRRFAGNLMRVRPASDDTEWSVPVRVVLDDPDSGGPQVVEDVAQLRAPRPPARVAAVLHVDAARGRPGASGTFVDPFATIQQAADAVSVADTQVFVYPGVYREQVVPPVGDVRFTAAGPGVVLDGSDAAIALGAPWTLETADVWWTPFAGTSLYAAVGDARIYDYQSLTDLVEENGNVGVPGIFPGGFFVDAAAQRLYLATPDHADPATRDIHVAVRDSAFLLDGLSGVVVEGFEMRYYGSRQWSGVGVDVRDSSDCWIRDNFMHHLQTGVRVRRPLSSRNVVERNRVRDTSVFDWPWASVKNHTPESTGIEVTQGQANVVRWNTVEGTFNGIYVGDFTDPDEDLARDTDVHDNLLIRNGDDGIELEGAVRNVRAWGNVVREVYNGISLAPVRTGPVHLVRTLIDGFSEHALKVNNGPTGWVFVHHSTAAPRDAATSPGAQAIAPSIPFGGLTLRNNIWEANRYVIEYGDTTLAGPVDWDWDCLWTHDVGAAGRFVKWLDVRYSDVAALAASGTIEARGLQVLPQYEDVAAGDYRPLPGHAVVDAGVSLPGVNDDAAGVGPDVGAFELGGDAPGSGVLRRWSAAGGTRRYLPARLPWAEPEAWTAALHFYRYENAPAPATIAVRKEGAGRVRVDVLP